MVAKKASFYSRHKKVLIPTGIIALLIAAPFAFYMFVQTYFVSGPWPEMTPEEKAYYQKKEQEHIKKLEFEKSIE